MAAINTVAIGLRIRQKKGAQRSNSSTLATPKIINASDIWSYYNKLHLTSDVEIGKLDLIDLQDYVGFLIG